MVPPKQNVSQSYIDFLFSELEYVNGHIDTIHNTRDRFFAQFLTVALGLYGLFGFILTKESGLGTLKSSTGPNLFLILLLVERFRINISINRVHMANSNLIHFVFPFEDNWHLVDLVNVLEDPFFELRF